MEWEAMGILFTLGLIPVMIILAVGVAERIGGKKSGKSKTEEADETRLIQEMHHGFLQMEDRIEALETLLIEKSKERKFEDELR